MTFLEKLKEDNPNLSSAELEAEIRRTCPHSHKYENSQDSQCYGNCTECWDREMPNTEPQVAITKDDLELEYNKGLEDAWELAKDVFKMTLRNRDDVFGYEGFIDILMFFTPQEALAKLKAYEEVQKIEVGDVVFCSLVAEDDNDTENKDNYGVVTGIYRDHYEILMKNGDTTGFKKENCKKTGKHLDLASILEQIGE